jgi:DNA topoisomerase-1
MVRRPAKVEAGGNSAVHKDVDPPKIGGARKKATKASPAKSGTNGELRKGKAASNRAGKNLVIVESPAKAKTIERILGPSYIVKASQGHVRDLPKGKLGVNVEEGFVPSYSLLKEKQAIVKELKTLSGKASCIYLATDPDREGEAIAWHLVEAASWDKLGVPLRRVVFHEITQEAVKKSFEHPRDIDMELVNSQQARRILDRLVGYQISPLLWKKVQRGLSAGRVQSVALRLVVDREREIGAFVPREYWTIEALLKKAAPEKSTKADQFVSALHSLKGQKGKLDIPNEVSSRQIEVDLEGADYAVAKVKQRETKQSPSPPFITSTLQQEAWRKLHFPPRKTMSTAQKLYEGLSIGDEGSVGLITYMRTDSTQVASTALQEAREYIRSKFGDEYVPNQPRFFRKKAKAAQEAHEAIRPTSVRREPAQLRRHLSSDQYKLYDLIWRRMLASQMADARSDATSIDTEAKCKTADKIYIFRATGSVLKFPGFRALYLEDKDEEEDQEDGKRPLPQLSEGEKLVFLNLDRKQHFTQPPPRYTEASLIKMLEEKGIGRPSTYAPIISTIMDRQYVQKEAGKLTPTTLGTVVCDLLVEYFTDIMDTNFTARMEEELDEVAQGERQWVPMLKDFYGPFGKSLEVAMEAMPRVKVEEATDQTCEKCGEPMVIKTGRFGKFLACTGFPTCKNTKPVDEDASNGSAGDGSSPVQEEVGTNELCEKCSQPMVVKVGRFGKFLACSDYPSCKSSKPILNKVGVPCPKCGGDLVQRKARGKGRVFYGCALYPGCDFVVNQRPLPEPCPECSGLMVAAGKDATKCTVCSWTGDAVQEGAVAAAG